MLVSAAPFAISFLFAPLILVAATWGGWTLLLAPFYAWFATSILDRLFGLDLGNADPATKEDALFWHRVVTWAWAPFQLIFIFGGLYAATAGHLTEFESYALMIGVGVATGGIGITYAHELIHQRNKWERGLGELLLVSVCYGHFATEHVFIHHKYVGTPRDPVTARYGEHLWLFLPRVLYGSLVSAWRVDVDMLRKRDLPLASRRNPWWRYIGGSLIFVAIAYGIGGWFGVGLYFLQAAVAILQLETVNYVEHYGLVRKHLGDGKYERCGPQHSWNSSKRVTNYLLINLQRHSDHHYRPDRRFPLLQTYDEDDAPCLPFGYPLMVALSMMPPVWFWIMNPRVRAWRERYYPEITNWAPYKYGLTTMPK